MAHPSGGIQPRELGWESRETGHFYLALTKCGFKDPEKDPAE